MAVFATLFAIIFTLTVCTSPAFSRYQPNWKSLDTRPNPKWYDESKLGIFIHWGVFSVPSIVDEWFWHRWITEKNPEAVNYMKKNFKPDFTYQDFGKDFTAEFFDANRWVELFQDAGAKYLVFISKHHEGYTNWPSKYAFSWNSMAVGPKRDIVGELANATRAKTDLKFGLYHSLYEWYNPLYEEDKKNNFTTTRFVDMKTLPELYEIVNKYKPEVVWSDGDWEAGWKYWKSPQFVAWLYNDSPVKDTVIINDRWGIGVGCKHGGVWTCGDRFNPGVLVKHKWVNAMTIDKYSWSYRRNAPLSDYLTIEELLQTFVMTVSCNGNMLMNVGPPHHGYIAPIYEERFRQMGSWLKVNGEGIYKSRPWTYQNDTLTPGVWYTKNNATGTTTVYAFVFDWPSSPLLSLALPRVSKTTTIELVGYKGYLPYNAKSHQGVDIQLPKIPVSKMPCKWLWSFKITNVTN